MDIDTVSESGVGLALQRQLVALERVAGRLASARAAMPSQSGDGVWSGDARRMYVRALHQLSAQVHAAASHVDEAIRDTRQALALLAAGSRDGGRHGW
jgi:hypothetical protein